MTVERESYLPADGSSYDAASLKTNTLLSRDLAMMATAAKYNLDKRADRKRSARRLVRLFFNLASVLEVDLFVECGAKEAAASRRAKRVFEGIRAVAFEANPFAYAKFRPDNANTGVEYLNIALSDSEGPVTFNVLRDEGGAPRSDGKSSLLKKQRGGVEYKHGFEEVTVPGVTLDGFFADAEFEKAAVWMDVEGACKFVFAGATDFLSKVGVLIIEVEEDHYWGADHWLRDQVVSHLYDAGLLPVARDFEFVYQHNEVFVRADLLAAVPRVRWALTRFASAAYTSPSALSDPTRPKLPSKVRKYKDLVVNSTRSAFRHQEVH